MGGQMVKKMIQSYERGDVQPGVTPSQGGFLDRDPSRVRQPPRPGDACFLCSEALCFFDTAPYNRGYQNTKGDACYVEHLARYQPRPHPTGGFRGRHRDPQRQQEEVRAGQGDRPHHPGPGALHLHPLPRQLRLHPPDLRRRRGPPGRAGGVLGVHRSHDPGALLPHWIHLHAGRGKNDEKIIAIPFSDPPTTTFRT